MKKIILTTALVLLATSVFGQSRSVERFRQTYRPELSLFFYKSTLRMFARLSTQLGQASELQPEGEEIPDLATMIEGIDKVKFFTYDPNDEAINHFDDLESDVEGEGYESVMTARFQGAHLNILMKEKRSKPDGFVVLIKNPEGGITLIDVDGVPDLTNLMELSKYMNSNSDSFSLLEAFR